MPSRRSHSGAPVKRAERRVNNRKRSINAFAIASAQTDDRVKIRQHRLGEDEVRDWRKKRLREETDGEDDFQAQGSRENANRPKKGRLDDPNIETGSDSDGNQWHLGHVDKDNDSDLDSEEALGESEEERFDGVTSAAGLKKALTLGSPHPRTLTLDEADGSEEEDFGTEGSDNASFDLAEMLDATEEPPPHAENYAKSGRIRDTATSEDNAAAESDDESLSSISADEDDEKGAEKLTALQALIHSLPQMEASDQASLRQRRGDASEFIAPSDFGFAPRAKLQLQDLALPYVRDPFVTKSLKLLASDSDTSANQKGAVTLAVPLAKRHQDRLERSAAYQKSRETMDRWTDTVQHNRRAEHLIFPLRDPDAASMTANTRLQPITVSKPFNQLEATIQSILEESGLVASGGKDDEDKLKGFEQLKSNKMAIEGIRARRDQLRKARDLLFREEARAKRIKKIKSKSYRKVHRKQREKEERTNRNSLMEAGADLSEDERDSQDRRRATHRMGDKHRSSKWARALKASGQAVWDEDARASISEMARRDEDLRKRVEGLAPKRDSEDDSKIQLSDCEISDTEDEMPGIVAKEGQTVLPELDKLCSPTVSGSDLSNMKFMLKADAARKLKNDQTVEQIKEWACEDDQVDSGGSEALMELGRQTFGPNSKPQDIVPTMQLEKRNTEYQGGRTWGKGSGTSGVPESSNSHGNKESKTEVKSLESNPIKSSRGLFSPSQAAIAIAGSEGGAWSQSASWKNNTGTTTARRRKHMDSSSFDIDEIDFTNAAVVSNSATRRSASKSKASFMNNQDSDGESDAVDDADHFPNAVQDRVLVERAFAGADVVADFATDKLHVIDDEDETVTENTLPGWGSWTGEGLRKREKQKNRGRSLTRSKGVKGQDRKDAKLERVIINEKCVKKNGRYLASSLPHPFETRQQYERSLRLPVGPEWTTKETFQEATKPRVLVKQGIIAPMSKPLL
ncbi:MAG: hypothetical protein M1818_001108 [Claussenomyces sp. TS43310]|nr:MAG: hypothetical protein M1818_001108 [Claussenomyces sp. TS43310]